MTRDVGTPVQVDVRLYRQAVERLKREIGGIDRNTRRRYIRDFHEEYGDYQALASFDDLLVDCLGSDVIFIGDYHALPASQEFAARLLSEVASRSRNVALCMEMVFGRHQRILDAWMAEEISEEDFLRRIRYDLDWGYSWPSFRGIFDTAREYHCRVYGLDCEPRASFRHIRKRDRYAAARIVSLLKSGAASKVVALIGESHLASKHLPALVRKGLKRARLEKRDVTVVQNMDEIYWKLAERGIQHADVVSLGGRRYCAMTAGLLEKYEAYRQSLERWKKEHGDDEIDLTSSVYNIVDTILEFLKIDKYKHCLSREQVCIEFMVDAYPEVYSNADEALVRRLLRNQSMEPEDEEEVLTHLARHGSCYVPRLNAILIGAFNLVHAGEEAGHFVNMALKGEVYENARHEGRQHDNFYTSVMEEALAFFASKLVHPTRNNFLESPFYRLYGKPKEQIEAEAGMPVEQFDQIVRFILVHKRMEQHYADYEHIPDEILRGIKASRRHVYLLTHELGYYLGQQMYDGLRADILTRGEITRLFRTRFNQSGSALRAYLDLAERLSSQPTGTTLPGI